MRTEILWNERIRHKVIDRLFPPRLANDLKFLENPVKRKYESLYLYGASHTGKTVFAAFCLLEEEKIRYLENRPGTCLFIGTSELLQEIKEAIGTGHDKEILSKYQKCSYLVLDDFGTVKPTDWVYQILYLIINYRYENMLPTIITSNFSLEEISEVMNDDRITSRIERMGPILLKKDFREKK